MSILLTLTRSTRPHNITKLLPSTFSTSSFSTSPSLPLPLPLTITPNNPNLSLHHYHPKPPQPKPLYTSLNLSILGLPNAGKSSLLSHLFTYGQTSTKFKTLTDGEIQSYSQSQSSLGLSGISAKAHTTREIKTVVITIPNTSSSNEDDLEQQEGGVQFQIHDTPGYTLQSNLSRSVHKEGGLRNSDALEGVDMLIVMIDGSATVNRDRKVNHSIKMRDKHASTISKKDKDNFEETLMLGPGGKYILLPPSLISLIQSLPKPLLPSEIKRIDKLIQEGVKDVDLPTEVVYVVNKIDMVPDKMDLLRIIGDIVHVDREVRGVYKDEKGKGGGKRLSDLERFDEKERAAKAKITAASETRSKVPFARMKKKKVLDDEGVPVVKIPAPFVPKEHHPSPMVFLMSSKTGEGGDALYKYMKLRALEATVRSNSIHGEGDDDDEDEEDGDEWREGVGSVYDDGIESAEDKELREYMVSEGYEVGPDFGGAGVDDDDDEEEEEEGEGEDYDDDDKDDDDEDDEDEDEDEVVLTESANNPLPTPSPSPKKAPPGWHFDPTLVSDLSDASRVQEIVREKVFRFLNEEVPYKIEFVNVYYDVRVNDAVSTNKVEVGKGKQGKVAEIEFALIVRSESHRKIVTKALWRITEDAKRDVLTMLSGNGVEEVKLVLRVKLSKTMNSLMER